MVDNTGAFDLKSERQRYGLSQVELGEIIFASQPSIARWEANGNMPKTFRALWSLWKAKNKEVKK